MFDSPVEEIKQRLDIVDIISGYIKLKKAGRDYKALCPFHNEKTPSFFVSPSKQIWHCFGCNAGGDMFSFIIQMEGVEFADALRNLANKAGVILKRQDPQLQSQRSKLYEICEEAADFFKENFQPSAGQPQAENEVNAVREYLKGRGISPKSIEEFKIGYALDSWDSLYNHLSSLGYKEEDAEKAGLIIKKEQNTKYYDRFRGRIMFPIWDISGQVIGFTGRVFQGDETTAKYVNSPETLIFNKSQILYPFNKAKVEIRKQDCCILVEGQMDVIMSHQAGFKNAVATSGTALTLDHLRIIKRYTENLLLAFDPDIAGEGATKKGIALAQGEEFNIGVIILDKGKDPADTIKENPKIWENAVENTKPIMEFYFEKAFSKYDVKKVEDKRRLAKELLPLIKKIANDIERAHWLQELAAKLNVSEKLLSEVLAKVGVSGEEDHTPVKDRITLEKSRIQSLEENLIGLAMKYPEHLNYIKDNLELYYFTNQNTKKIFQGIKGGKDIRKNILPLQPHYLDHLVFQVEHYNLEGKDIIKEINFCVKEIRSNYFKKKLSEVSLAIKKAEREGDKNELKKLTEEFNKLSKDII